MLDKKLDELYKRANNVNKKYEKKLKIIDENCNLTKEEKLILIKGC